MKKIVYLISTLHRTGPTNVLAGIVNNLDKNQFYPIIITLSPEPDIKNSWWPELERKGIKLYSLNLPRIKGLFFASTKLKKLINILEPDIIHCHCFRSTVLAGKVLKKYNRIATIHCDYEIDFKMVYGAVLGKIMSFLYTRALKQMKIKVACSKMLADLLNKKYPYMFFNFVNNGVDTNKFCAVEDKKLLRKKLNLPLDKKIVIWAGSFIDRKDPLTMVKAIKEIPHNKYYFVFCGARGPLLNVCKEELKNRKDVLFTGYITNIAEYFQASDIYVSTSLSEGFHLTVYEAMACGMPVILTDIEVYKNLKNNSAVLFYNSKNNRDLTSKLTELLDNNYNKNLSIIAQETVVKNYSAHNMAREYMKIYEDLL